MYIEPCCANQKPSLNPAILISFSRSANMIPAPKETVNHIIRSTVRYFKFLDQ